MKKTFFFLFLLSFHALFAEIFEVKNFEKIKEHLAPGMLILVDIDNTLIRPAQTIGSDQWYNWQKKEYIASGMSPEMAREKLLPEYDAIQNISEFIPVEESTSAVIASLQQEGFSVMGLTIKGFGLARKTHQVLHSFGIHFSFSCEKEHWFLQEKPLLFYHGALYTNGYSKAKALFQFLDCMNLAISSILLIDDNENNLIALESACRERNIGFVGLRYGYLDEWVKSLSPEVCRIEFENFRRILSDDEVVKMIEEIK